MYILYLIFVYWECIKKAKLKTKLKTKLKKLQLKIQYMLGLIKTDGNAVIKDYLEKKHWFFFVSKCLLILTQKNKDGNSGNVLFA